MHAEFGRMGLRGTGANREDRSSYLYLRIENLVGIFYGGFMWNLVFRWDWSRLMIFMENMSENGWLLLISAGFN